MYQMTGGTGSLRYMAPEVANHKEYNEKVIIEKDSDIYDMLLFKRRIPRIFSLPTNMTNHQHHFKALGSDSAEFHYDNGCLHLTYYVPVYE